MNTNERVAVVTGASQGIGAELVKAYLDCGYRVVANARRIEPGLNAAGTLLGVPGNIGDPSVAKNVIDGALATFGRVDTLINNAGIFVPKAFVDYTEEDYSNVLNVNLAGFFFVTQHAMRQMLKQGRGHVVQISTSLVDQPIKGVEAALASLTKGGLNAATRALAIEYADRGIRVNAVSPGIINTPMHDPKSHDFLSGLHPMKRMGEAQEIVDAVLYLESAQFVTGEVLHVDGGQHAGRW